MTISFVQLFFGCVTLGSKFVKIKTGVKSHTIGSAEVVLGATHVTASVSIQNARNQSPGLRHLGVISCRVNLLPDSIPLTSKDPLVLRACKEKAKFYERLVERAMKQAVSQSDIAGLVIQIEIAVVYAAGSTSSALVSAAWVALEHGISTLNTTTPKKSISLKNLAVVSFAVHQDSLFFNPGNEIQSIADLFGHTMISDEGSILEIELKTQNFAISPKQLAVLGSSSIQSAEKIMSEHKLSVKHKTPSKLEKMEETNANC